MKKIILAFIAIGLSFPSSAQLAAIHCPACTSGPVYDLCTGSTYTFTDSTPGGNWFAAWSGVIVDSVTGVVTVTGTGPNDICYYRRGIDTVCVGIDGTIPYPPVMSSTWNAGIHDTSKICIGAMDTLASVRWDTGGSYYSSDTAVAKVLNIGRSTLGKIYGISSGSAIITYQESQGCYATKTISVIACPTEVVDASTAPISVFPNPANDQLSITGQWKTVTIVNALGQVMKQAEHVPVDISLLSPGIYFAVIKDDETTIIRKFIKQ